MKKCKLLCSAIFTIVLLSSPFSSFGQKCQTSHNRTERIAQHPEIQQEIDRINHFTEEWIAAQKTSVQQRAVVTLPVVVHVVYLNNAENISEAQIMSQIDVLNEDFRKLNSNFSNTPAVFQAIAADVEIEFCLASIDPNGNPTNGITRTMTTVAELGETENFYKTSGGGHDPWDNTKYINIWVCNQEDGSLGFATPPGTASPSESDGIVIPSVYFGTVGTAAGSVPNHLGRTCTHEMGHYLNLEHIWGPGEGGCDEDDFIADTPEQDVESGGCPTFPLTDYCTYDGNGINFQNYLDYSDDDCMSMFTEGQKLRMLAAVNGPRASLLNSNACSSMVATNDLNRFENAINVFPNPASQLLTISIEDIYTTANSKWDLIDVLGKSHLSFTMTEKKELNIAHLPGGVYYLTCSDFPKAVKKIIITK